MSLTQKFLIEIILLALIIFIPSQIIKYSYIKPTIQAGYNETIVVLNELIKNPQNIRSGWKQNLGKDPYMLWACGGNAGGTADRWITFDTQVDGERISPVFSIDPTWSNERGYFTIATLRDLYQDSVINHTTIETKNRIKKIAQDPKTIIAASEEAEFKKFTPSEASGGFDEIYFHGEVTWYFNQSSLPNFNKAQNIIKWQQSLNFPGGVEGMILPTQALTSLMFGCTRGLIIVFLYSFIFIICSIVGLIYSKRYNGQPHGLIKVNLIFWIVLFLLTLTSPIWGLVVYFLV